MNPEQRALLGVIQEFKPAGITDLEAALNAIMHHAKTIQEQHEEIKRLEVHLSKIQELATHPPAPAPGNQESNEP